MTQLTGAAECGTNGAATKKEKPNKLNGEENGLNISRYLAKVYVTHAISLSRDCVTE